MRQATHIDIGLVQDTLVIRVVGRGTADFCPELDAHIKDFLQKSPVSRVFFDAEEASYMDSSFIGVILAVKKRFAKENSVFLVNPDARIVEIFKVMGLSDFIPSLSIEGFHDLKGATEIHQKLENTISDIRLLLEAHQNIMETSPENSERFDAVEKALKDELNRKKSSE